MSAKKKEVKGFKEGDYIQTIPFGCVLINKVVWIKGKRWYRVKTSRQAKAHPKVYVQDALVKGLGKSEHFS